MRATGRTASGVLAAVALLAGCSGDGDDEPVTLPPTTVPTASTEPITPSTTTAPSAEPTPTTTLVLPDEHVEGADAFVLDFFTALNTATNTGEFATFDAMYLAQCSGCVEYRAESESWLANGQTVDGGQWVVLQQNSKELFNGDIVSFRVFAFRSAATIRAASGDILRSVPVTEVLLGSGALRPGEPWLVEDLSLSAPEIG